MTTAADFLDERAAGLTASAVYNPADIELRASVDGHPASVALNRFSMLLAAGTFNRVMHRSFMSPASWAAVREFVQKAIGPLDFHVDGGDKSSLFAAGESVAATVHVRYGDEFDGLVGQGLKVMVLVSTNVERASFAQAVVRTGRCGALVEFPPFTADEAAAWCTERGLPPVDGPATLAELYSLTIGAV